MKIAPLVFAAALAVFLVLRHRRLEKPLRIGGAIAVAGLCVYGTGVVQLPSLEQLLLDIGETLGRWTYLLVGGLAFLETGAFIGLLVPGETAMILGGVVAGQGQIDVVTLIGITWTCAVLGDCASFYFGRRLGREFMVKHGPRVQITPDRLEKVEDFFEQHGGKAIFIGRFVGLVRAIAPFLAGSGGMAFRRFLPFDVLGAGLWATAFIMLGYVFWHSLDRVLTLAKQGALGLGLVISVIVGLVWIVRHFREEENRAAFDARVMRALDRPGLRILRPVAMWLRGPARFFLARITPGQLGLELTTLFAIAAVGSFALIGTWITVKDGSFAPGDQRVYDWTQTIENDTLTDVAKVVTHLGDPPVVYLVVTLAVLLLLVRRRLMEALVLGAGMIMTVVAVNVGKNVVDRARPPDQLVDTAGSSFPSGHAAYAIAWVALAVIAVRVVPALRGKWVLVVAAILLALAVAATRVYLRVHWLSDVSAGAGAAAMCWCVAAMVGLVVAFVRHNDERR
jgi:membrane protein DedA with SNARE-associated domain/membrane-associated phospholipid phosphatase